MADCVGGNSNLAVAGPTTAPFGEVSLHARNALSFALIALPAQEELNLARALCPNWK